MKGKKMSHNEADSKLPERVLAQFKRVTGAPQNIAISYLEEDSWQLSAAVDAFFDGWKKAAKRGHVTFIQEQLYSSHEIGVDLLLLSDKEKSLQRWRALILREEPKRSVREMLLDQAEEQPESLLLTLPIELLSLIFSQVRRATGVNGLFLSCFLLSKKCLQAVMDEWQWMEFCRIDFGLSEKDEETWYLTYRGTRYNFTSPPPLSLFHMKIPLEATALAWDPKHHTLSPMDRSSLLSSMKSTGFYEPPVSPQSGPIITEGSNITLHLDKHSALWTGEYMFPSLSLLPLPL